jgi:hypothetical protein
MLCLTWVIAVLTLANVAFVAYSVWPTCWMTPSAHNGRVISSQPATAVQAGFPAQCRRRRRRHGRWPRADAIAIVLVLTTATVAEPEPHR